MQTQIRTKVVVPLFVALGTLLVVVGLLGPATGSAPATAASYQVADAPTPTPTPIPTPGDGTNGDHEPGFG